MDYHKAYKTVSHVLTALTAVRSLIRSSAGIKKLLSSGNQKNVALPVPAVTATVTVKQKQLQGALKELGYSAADVNRAVAELYDRLETDSLSDLLRRALTFLN